jgi:predicted DsbA family dithiol-disulfide isomerase
MTERMTAFFAARDLRYRPHPEVVPRSLPALRLGELARLHGIHEPFHASVMTAYWDDSRDIGDPAVLRELACEVGLARAEATQVLESDRFADAVGESTRQAVSIGVTGVPGFLLDGRLLVLGAQPEEAFEDAFSRLAHR